MYYHDDNWLGYQIDNSQYEGDDDDDINESKWDIPKDCGKPPEDWLNYMNEEKEGGN